MNEKKVCKGTIQVFFLAFYSGECMASFVISNIIRIVE